MTVVCASCDRTATGSPHQLPDGWLSRPSSLTGAIFLKCGQCAEQEATAPARAEGATPTDAAAQQLLLLIERIERLEEEERGIRGDKMDVYSEAKATGYDTKTIKAIVKLRRMDPLHRQESQALLDTYMAALGLE